MNYFINKKIKSWYPLNIIAVLFLICVFFSISANAFALNGNKSLREYAADYDFLVGAAADANQIPSGRNPIYTGILAGEFNKVSTENELTWKHIETYGYWGADQIINFAIQNNMAASGHTLLWQYRNPQWLIDGLISNPPTIATSQLPQILHDHINEVVTRYKGKIKYWVVVNEAIYPWPVQGVCRFRDYSVPNIPPIGSASNPANPFFPSDTEAYEAIKNAFIWTHQIDPDAILLYNDYHAEEMNFKSDCVYNLLDRLLADNVPVHGVGLQMHTGIPGPNIDSIKINIQRLVSLGLEVHITEMDVAVPQTNPTAADFQAQAQVYKNITVMCLQTPGCKSVQTWGLTDAFSWISSYQPLLFDRGYNPKPAYYSMLSAFGGTTSTLGDANGDGNVNGADYIVWMDNYSQTYSLGPSVGDFNNSRNTDGLDYIIWLDNYR